MNDDDDTTPPADDNDDIIEEETIIDLTLVIRDDALLDALRSDDLASALLASDNDLLTMMLNAFRDSVRDDDADPDKP